MIRSQRFCNYLVSYILVVVTLLTLVSGVVYETFFHTLRKEVETSTLTALSQVRDAVDQRMGELMQTAQQIADNSMLTPFMVSDGGYGSLKAVEELGKYRSANRFIHDIVLYYNHPAVPQLYAASGTYDPDLFFDRIYHYRNWDHSQFLKALSEMGGPVFRPLEPVEVNRVHTQQFMTCLYPIPLKSAKPYGAVMFLIDEATIAGMVRSALGQYQGFMYILNEKNDPVFRMYNGETRRNAERVQAAMGQRESAVSTLSMDGQEYSVLKLTSEYNGWSYLIAMPSEQWLGKVEETRNLFNLTVAAVFLAGLGMAVGFSIRHYRPLQKLAGSLASAASAGRNAKRKDELDIIAHAVGEMTREKEGLLHQLRSQANALKEQSLLALISGRAIGSEELESMMKLADLRMPHSHYAVMLFLVDDYARFRQINSPSMQEILKYSLIKVVEEMSHEIGCGYGVELTEKQGIAFVFNLRDEAGTAASLKELAWKAKEFFRQYFRHSVTVGLGRICRNPADISQSFLQASQAARYRFIKGCDQVICYDELEAVRRTENAYPVDLQLRFAKAIKQGNCREAEYAVSRAFRHVTDNNLPLETAECVCFDIVNTMLKTLMELEIGMDEELEGIVAGLFVPRFETIGDLERFVIGFCGKVCRHIEGRKESRNTALLQRMLKYLEEHYPDHSINLESIAGQFGLSPSYATRFFNDQTGYPLMRYLDSIRMDRAKELLRNTDLQLGDILARVGYVDCTNFIRKFKKAEGITPIQYRTLVRG